MAWAERHRIDLATTASSCTVTAYTTGPGITGKVQSIIYYLHGTVPFSTTCDLTISVEGTSQVIYSTTGLDASEVISPRIPTHNTTGLVLGNTTAISGAASIGIASDYIYLANDRVKVVVVSGGLSKQGTVDIIIT